LSKSLEIEKTAFCFIISLYHNRLTRHITTSLAEQSAIHFTKIVLILFCEIRTSSYVLFFNMLALRIFFFCLLYKRQKKK